MWVIGQKSNIYKIKYMYKSKHTGNTIDEQIEKSLNGENIIENTVDYIDPLESRPISSARIYKAMADEEFIPKNILRIGNNLDDKRQKTYYGLKEYIRTIVPNITTNANDFFNIKKIQSIDDFTTVEISPNIVDLNEENNGFIDAEGCKKYINNLIEDYLKDIEKLNEKTSNKVDKEYGKGLSTNDYTNEDHERVWNSVTSIRVNGNEFAEKYSAGLLDIGDVSNLYVADFTIHDLSLLLYGGEIESLEVNGKALLQALKDHKAIGVLLDNGVPSMSLASVSTDDCINLTIISDDMMYTTTVVLPENYAEVEESKSGIIYKGQTADYQLGTYRQHLLDIVSDDVRDAYLNNQEITCEYYALRDAVVLHRDIRIEAGFMGGAVPVNAYLSDDDTIELSYIVGDNLWQMTIYHSEDEDGNVYGRVFGNEIIKIDLSDIKNGSRYIITDFTIEDIIDNDAVTITHELVKAIIDKRPLAIYYATGESNICDITEVSADLTTQTRISLKVSYRGGGNLIIESSNIVAEGGRIRASSYWKADPNNTRLIANSSGGIIYPDDGVITVPPSFFADKSVEVVYGDLSLSDVIPINNQITILERVLREDKRVTFPPPTIGTAVEYTIKFYVDTQCSLVIYTDSMDLLYGECYGQTLSNIPEGNYLMKITLYTYINANGNEETKYIAEVMHIAI